MKPNSRTVRLLTCVALMIGTLSACAHSPSPVPLARSLPPPSLVVPDPGVCPSIKKGEDVRLFAKKALRCGDANARRLRQAAEAYADVVESYAN